MTLDSPLTCLVLSGGLGLGAYHGGAFERLHRQATPLDWVTGSSAGAISAALIAGSPPELRLSNLRSFWQADATSRADKTDSSRHGFAWMNSISTHLFGRAGFFYPRLPLPTSRFYGLYDLAPARERLRGARPHGPQRLGWGMALVIAAFVVVYIVYFGGGQ